MYHHHELSVLERRKYHHFELIHMLSNAVSSTYDDVVKRALEKMNEWVSVYVCVCERQRLDVVNTCHMIKGVVGKSDGNDENAESKWTKKKIHFSGSWKANCHHASPNFR